MFKKLTNTEKFKLLFTNSIFIGMGATCYTVETHLAYNNNAIFALIIAAGVAVSLTDLYISRKYGDKEEE